MKLRRQGRTGIRPPKGHLKVSADPNFTRQLTGRVSVAVVHEDLPLDSEGKRHSWYLSVTTHPDFAKAWPVDGVPAKGTTVLLFEDDVVRLFEYLRDTHLVIVNKSGRVCNGGAAAYKAMRKLLR